MTDAVNRPSHYTYGGIEVLDVIEGWKLNYHVGNAVKYLARAGRKNEDKASEDLQKAAFYLRRYWPLRNSEKIVQIPPFVNGVEAGLEFDKVVKAWSLDAERAAVLAGVWHGFVDTTALEVAGLLDALAAKIDAVGVKEALCLSPQT